MATSSARVTPEMPPTDTPSTRSKLAALHSLKNAMLERCSIRPRCAKPGGDSFAHLRAKPPFIVHSQLTVLNMTSHKFGRFANPIITLALLGTLVCCALPASADVNPPAMFTDHAVLQREMPVPVWGWADPGEEVTVTIAGQTQKTKADEKGKWRVTLEPLKVGDPLTLVVEGKNRLERKDILVGEVWLCSGQSNMEFALANANNGDLDVAAAIIQTSASCESRKRAAKP